MKLALKHLRVVGEIHSNIPYVRELIMTHDFLGNKIDTAWLDKLIAAQMQLPPPAARDVAVCGALLKVHLAIKETTSKLLKDYIARNAAPPPEALQSLVEMKVDFIWANTKFTLEVYRHSRDLYTVAANGSLLQAKFVMTPSGSFVCSFAGESHKVCVTSRMLTAPVHTHAYMRKSRHYQWVDTYTHIFSFITTSSRATGSA